MGGDEEMLEGEAPAQPNEPSYVDRETPDPEPSKAALIKHWGERVQSAKRNWDKAFKRMEKCMAIADGYQWDESYSEYDNRYIANIVQRHIHQRTSALYAKNPTVVARRKNRRVYKIWDGNEQTLMQAMMIVQQAQQMAMQMSAAAAPMMANPAADQMMAQVQQAQMLIEDYQQGQQYEQMMDALGETLEILSSYFQDEQHPRFKQQMKQAVRRALITGVAYAKLTFQRETGLPPDTIAVLNDYRGKLAELQRLAADSMDKEFDNDDAEAEKLKLMIEKLMAEAQEIVLREGPVWAFPRTQNIIIDPNCRELVDFVGANWIAEEYLLTCDDVQRIYGKDVKTGGGYSKYGSNGQVKTSRSAFDVNAVKAEEDGLVCVWEIWDKATGLVFVIADGYTEYLRDPKEPPLSLENFFPYFTLCFNQLESTEELFPQSDVWLLRHPQREYNRNKEALRQHRHAARPLYIAPPGWSDDKELDTLVNAPAHGIVTLSQLGPGQKPSDLIQPLQKHQIDPNHYETATTFDDVQRVVGTQEANIGGTSNATATESSIAESSRMSSLGSQSDDLDDMLTAMKRAEGQVLLSELSQETVFEIVGPGAVWGEFSASDIIKEIGLEIEAGSSGRPNQAADAQIFQQMMPLMIQIPGVKPDKLAEVGLKIMDARFRLKDFMDPMLPSITAMNAMAGKTAGQPATGDPATDPGQQGNQGQNNAPQPKQGGDQPVPSGPGQQGTYPAVQ